MKKIRLLATLTVMMTMFISNAYAAEYFGEEDAIEITGGIDMDREKESTFNDTRTITGRAEKGTNITINVCTENEDYDEEEEPKYIVLEAYEIEIGASGYFSRNVKLFEGENVIIICTEDNSSGIIACIKRKDAKIKDKLERGVCMPGSGYVPYIG